MAVQMYKIPYQPSIGADLGAFFGQIPMIAADAYLKSRDAAKNKALGAELDADTSDLRGSPSAVTQTPTPTNAQSAPQVPDIGQAYAGSGQNPFQAPPINTMLGNVSHMFGGGQWPGNITFPGQNAFAPNSNWLPGGGGNPFLP